MKGYSIKYALTMAFQKEISGSLNLPWSYKLTEQEILFTLFRKEPELKHAISLSVRASEVSGDNLEDYLKKTYSHTQLSDFFSSSRG